MSETPLYRIVEEEFQATWAPHPGIAKLPKRNGQVLPLEDIQKWQVQQRQRALRALAQERWVFPLLMGSIAERLEEHGYADDAPDVLRRKMYTALLQFCPTYDLPAQEEQNEEEAATFVEEMCNVLQLAQTCSQYISELLYASPPPHELTDPPHG